MKPSQILIALAVGVLSAGSILASILWSCQAATITVVLPPGSSHSRAASVIPSTPAPTTTVVVAVS